jgi:hypothetical protein
LHCCWRSPSQCLYRCNRPWINEGNLAVADWFKTHVPKGSIVVAMLCTAKTSPFFSVGTSCPIGRSTPGLSS